MQGVEPEEVELEAALDLLRQRALRPPSARSQRRQPGSKGTAAAALDTPRSKARAKAKSAARAAKASKAATPQLPAAAAAAAAKAGAADPEPKDPKPRRRAGARGAGAPAALPAKARRRAGGPAWGATRNGVSGGAEGGDPKPRRPLSAYLRFCGQERAALRCAQPDLKPSEAWALHASTGLHASIYCWKDLTQQGHSPAGRCGHNLITSFRLLALRQCM